MFNRRSILAVTLGCLVSCLLAGSGTGQIIRGDLWMPEGAVYSVAQAGNTLYIAGSFASGDLPVGTFVGIDASSGLLRARYPNVLTQVKVIVPDGSGGWYVGGDGSQTSGKNLVHILADRTVSAWNPGITGVVHALAVVGSTLYVGGAFGHAGGKPRNCVAAIDANTGQATPWNPNASNPYEPAVLDLEVSGSIVYVAGGFSNIGGQPRNGIAALDIGTGLATSWNPNPDSQVHAIAVSGTTVYAGGRFLSIGGQLRPGLAALDAVTAQATSWSPNPGGGAGGVNALVVSGGSVYAAGSFSSIGGQARQRLAEIDAVTGLATAWNPGANDTVSTLVVSGDRVFAGGRFTTIGGASRSHLAVLDVVTGAATPWNPGASGYVSALAVSGSTVFAAGVASLGWAARNNIAALNLITGQTTSWNPDVNGTVRAMAMVQDTLYLGGDFTSVGGQTRNRVAALDLPTGQPLPWNPNADETVRALAPAGGRIYVAGDFWNIGGGSRRYLAALDTDTGQSTTWNPTVNNWVFALALSGNTVYAGGMFTDVGGFARNRIAALDAVTAQPTSWNPNASSTVYAIEAAGNTVYTGGDFTTIGGAARNRIAALDATTGQPNPWDAGTHFENANAVFDLVVSGQTVYAGGDFRLARVCHDGECLPTPRMFAAFDAASGLPTAWRPDSTAPSGSVRALLRSENAVYAGGEIWSWWNGFPLRGIVGVLDAAVVGVPLGPASSVGLALSQNYPNPFKEASVIRFSLPRAGRVNLKVYDLNGRHTATLLDAADLGAGEHRVTMDARTMRPGLLWYRLVWNGHVVSRPMVVVR